MQKNTRRAAAGWILAAAAALSGCGGSSGTKPSAHIRAVDVATNTIDTGNSNKDAGSVLVNGASSTIDSQYGAASPYLYVEAGDSSFQGKSYLTNPSFTDPTTSVISVPATPIIQKGLDDGQSYTAYLIGRRDVTNPVDAAFTGFDYTHFLNVVVLQDNQAAPPSGQANVRVLVAGPDIPAVNVLVNGTAPVALTNLHYAATETATVDVPVTAGSVSFSVNATGAGTPIVAATPLNLSAGKSYTLVVTEPSGAVSPGNTTATPPVVTTYGLALIPN